MCEERTGDMALQEQSGVRGGFSQGLRDVSHVSPVSADYYH